MDQCEDREEGVPPSKSTLCGEHESQTKAQRAYPGPQTNILGKRKTEEATSMRDKTFLPPKMQRPDEQNQPFESRQNVSDDSSCGSANNDSSEERPIDFTGQQHSAAERGQRSQSPVSSCVSMSSDWSKPHPPNFSNEPGPTLNFNHGPELTEKKPPAEPGSRRGGAICCHRLGERKRSGVCEEERLSCCALCQDVLKDPVSISCGHWFCRQCISSYWDQSASSGDSSCPQCGERSRTRAGLQTASQSSCVQTDVGLQEVLDEHKISLRRRCERVTEGSDETGSRTLLNRIYTELYITEGQSEEVHTQHEFQPFIVNELLIPVYMTCKNNTEHIRLNMEKKHHSPASLKL